MTQDEGFYQRLAAANSRPLWRMYRAAAQKSIPKPYIWRWELMERLAREAIELESTRGIRERRALTLIHPGLGGQGATTKTMSAAIQIVPPGEIAEAHRHTATAIRFIIHGTGAFTVQDGERFVMEEGDLVLTPNWTWHDHGNLTNEPMIWLDGLDGPLVGFLDASFQEPYYEDTQPVTRPTGYTNNRIGGGLMRGILDKSLEKPLPITYKWGDAYRALVESDQATPFDGVAIEYINPLNGGHTLPTMACRLQRLRPGEHTGTHRHTSSTVYHGARGQGVSVISGVRVDWRKGDTFVLPPWAWHEHANPSAYEDAVLFSISDLPVLEALGLHREEEGARQEVVESLT